MLHSCDSFIHQSPPPQLQGANSNSNANGLDFENFHAKAYPKPNTAELDNILGSAWSGRALARGWTMLLFTTNHKGSTPDVLPAHHTTPTGGAARVRPPRPTSKKNKVFHYHARPPGLDLEFYPKKIRAKFAKSKSPAPGQAGGPASHLSQLSPPAKQAASPLSPSEDVSV